MKGKLKISRLIEQYDDNDHTSNHNKNRVTSTFYGFLCGFLGLREKGKTENQPRHLALIWIIHSKVHKRGRPGVAQSAKHRTLGFDSGRDLRVMRSSPLLGSALGVESVRDSLPL